MNIKNCKWYLRDKDGYYIQSGDKVVYFEDIAEAQFFLNDDGLIEEEIRGTLVITLEKPDWYNDSDFEEIEAKESLYLAYQEAARKANTIADAMKKFGEWRGKEE